MIIFFILYVFTSLFVGIMSYGFINPYGHITKRQQWIETITLAVFWPFMLIYAIICAIYYHFKK